MPSSAARPRDVDTAWVHEQAAGRLAALDQRYTTKRRALVHSLAEAGRPVTIADIVNGGSGFPMSSAYRNLTVLCEAGVARRLAGADDLGRFELAEDLSGDHHHHLVCRSCGTVVDVRASPRLEEALVAAARGAARETGFDVDDHRIELIGRCPACRSANAAASR